MRQKPRKNTFRHVIESIITSLSRSGFQHLESRFSQYQIFDLLLSLRAAYIKRTKIQRLGIGQQNVQTIKCIDLKEVDQEICPCNAPSGCMWLVSKEPLPKVIFTTLVANNSATFIAEYVEWGQFKNKITSRSFDKRQRYYTWLDSGEGAYLYLYNDDWLENVSVTGVWENPNEAATFEGCAPLSKEQKFLLCNPLDTPIYTDLDIVDVLTKQTLDYISRTTPISTIDVSNDNVENAGGVQNPTV